MITKVKKIKSPYQSLIFSTLLGILASGVIGFLVISTWKINQRRAELTARIEALKKEIQILEEKNAALKAGITQTESEDYWKEKLYQQGYVEKGEKQVVVLPPKGSEEEKTEQEKTLWQKFLDPVRSFFEGL